MNDEQKPTNDLTPDTDPVDDQPADIEAVEDTADTLHPVEEVVIVETDAPEADPEEDLDTFHARAEVFDAPDEQDDWFPGDVDEALAAVAALSEIMPDTEADEQARDDAKALARTPKVASTLPAPPLFALKRGSLGSIVPALLLIGGGAYLTLTLASGGTVDPLLVALGAFAAFVISLFAAWIASGRWHRGLAFFALLLLLVGGVVVFALQPTGIDLTRAYPLLLAAAGVAFVLVGVIARPAQPRLIAPGAVLILGAIAGMAFTLDLIPQPLTSTITLIAPFVLVGVVVILLLPLVFRRRRGETT